VLCCACSAATNAEPPQAIRCGCRAAPRRSLPPSHRACLRTRTCTRDTMRTAPSPCALPCTSNICKQLHSRCCDRRGESLGEVQANGHVSLAPSTTHCTLVCRGCRGSAALPSSLSRRRPAAASRPAFSLPARHKESKWLCWTVGFCVQKKQISVPQILQDCQRPVGAQTHGFVCVEAREEIFHRSIRRAQDHTCGAHRGVGLKIALSENHQ